MRPAAEIDLDDHSRLHPNRLASATLLDRNGFAGHFVGSESNECAKELACCVVGKAGTCTTGIMQLSAVVEAEHQCANGAGICSRRYNPGNDQLLPVRALCFHPIMAATGVIRCVCDL